MLSSIGLASLLGDAAVAAVHVPYPCPYDLTERYRLEELLRAGPRAWLYRGTDRALSADGHRATVAVKISRLPIEEERESLLARRVDHPNVVRVLDRGVTPAGARFVVLELVTGGDLGDQPVPWGAARACRFVRTLALAVQAAHDKGVVHCDIKPSNILLTASGEPKLADFDLAAADADNAGGRRGNLAFMAPEQHSGEPGGLTAAADVYALGGILHYLLTGNAPNGADAETAEAYLRGENTQSSPTVIPGAQADLSAICSRALARERSDRYRSAQQLAEDLEALLSHRPIAWRSPSAPRRLRLWARRRPAVAVAVTALGLAGSGGFGGMWWWERTKLQRELAAEREALRVVEREFNTARKDTLEKFAPVMAILRVGTDDTNHIVPILALLDMLCVHPLLSADGTPALADERLELLRHAYDALVKRDQGNDFDAFALRYGAARLAVTAGRYEEAEADVAWLLSHPLGEAAGRSFRIRCELIRLCAQAQRGDPRLAAAALAEIDDRDFRGELFEAGSNINQLVTATRRAIQSGPAVGRAKVDPMMEVFRRAPQPRPMNMSPDAEKFVPVPPYSP